MSDDFLLKESGIEVNYSARVYHIILIPYYLTELVEKCPAVCPVLPPLTGMKLGADFFKTLLPYKSKEILCLFPRRICIMGSY